MSDVRGQRPAVIDADRDGCGDRELLREFCREVWADPVMRRNAVLLVGVLVVTLLAVVLILAEVPAVAVR